MSPAVMPTVMVVPTGIGCEIGGFAGDAIPSARLLASASGCLITHPNVMNGASLYWVDSRIHYVEGFGLDRFVSGDWHLRPVRRQRIGLLLDAGIEAELAQRQIQVLEGCRASLGLDIGPVITSDAPLEVSLEQGKSGASWDAWEDPMLFCALVNASSRQVQPRLPCCSLPDDIDTEQLAAYRQGSGVDALAGAEAVISHLLVRHLKIPCAHAPALAPLPLDPQLDPRAAGEELGHTFLACVLVGLSRAPDLVSEGACRHGDLTADQIGAIVAPQGALGGEAVLACLERQVPLITVENRSVLSVTSDALALGPDGLRARSYSEAAGLLLALREGLAPESLVRPFQRRQAMG